jgi:hypothetical protein
LSMQGHSSSSGASAPCVPLVQRRITRKRKEARRSFRWFSSAHSSPSSSRRTAACRRRECPCCASGPPLFCRRSASALGERTRSCATDPVLLEQEHQQYHPVQTPSEALSQLKRLQFHGPTAGPVADSMRSTFGCGAPEEVFHGRFLLQARWPCGSSGFRNSGNKEKGAAT